MSQFKTFKIKRHSNMEQAQKGPFDMTLERIGYVVPYGWRGSPRHIFCKTIY